MAHEFYGKVFSYVNKCTVAIIGTLIAVPVMEAADTANAISQSRDKEKWGEIQSEGKRQGKGGTDDGVWPLESSNGYEVVDKKKERKWAGQDLNSRSPPCQGGILTRLDHRPYVQ